ncbi:MAG: hypothetical protein JSS82_19825 [Bacteroidetes bacterium]|nr:hypothetical protein [Bacteroidota bacterium]
MTAYKVRFENGNASGAEEVNPALYRSIVKFDGVEDARHVLWYIIHCDSEDEAITVADRVVKKIWGVSQD